MTCNDDLWTMCGETMTKNEKERVAGVEIDQNHVFRMRVENAGSVRPPGPGV